MSERRARGRLPKIDPLPYDIATACYAIGTRVEVPAGAYLYRQGDTADRVYCIGAGYAKITSESPAGHQIVIAFLGPRYTVGLAGMYTPPVYTFNAIAADTLIAYGWTRAQAAELIRHPALRHYLDQVFHHYTEVLATRLHTLSDGLPFERLAAVLLELAVMHGSPAHGGLIEVDPPVSFEDLGGLSGTTVETVNRFITQWREAGAVLPRTGRKKLWLHPERLRDVVFRNQLPVGA
jgi:CRP-like cAMP-binding protein